MKYQKVLMVASFGLAADVLKDVDEPYRMAERSKPVRIGDYPRSNALGRREKASCQLRVTAPSSR